MWTATRYLFAVALVATPLVHADDAVVGSGTPSSCNEASFDAALTNVLPGVQGPGGTLTFNCGANPHTIAFSAQKFLSNQVTIDGGNRITLDGQDATRLFRISLDGPVGKAQTLVTIRNIDLTRGNSGAEPFGGLILGDPNVQLTLNNVTLRNSLASTTGGALAMDINTRLNIVDSRFLGNLSANGGALGISSITEIIGTVFNNNNASGGEGGAIQSYTESLSVVRSTFTGNSARIGGAIYKLGSAVGLSEAHFNGNTSSQDGGAIAARGGATTFVTASQFASNHADLDGGAISAQGFVIIETSTLAANTARSGGAIRVDGQWPLDLATSTLNDNVANQHGGAISLVNAGQSSAIGINFRLNYVTTSNNTAIAGQGGDLSISANTILGAQISNSTLMLGSAGTGLGSTVMIAGPVRMDLHSSILCARAGNACDEASSAQFFTAGGNIANSATCSGIGDVEVTLCSEIGLGELAQHGGQVNTFLPLPASISIDQGLNCGSFDVRGKPSPINGDGIGDAQCDSGAVERQLVEAPGVLFGNGFE